MIGIITDSASDTPVELIRNEGIQVVPLKIFLGDKEYKDAVEATEEMCLDYMKTDFAKTSGTPYPFVREGFERLIAKGIREIIAINVSNNISNGHSVFKVVAEELKKVYEDLKVEIVDTLSISIGSGLLVCKAAELRAEGYTLEKMANVLRAYVPQDLDVYYVVPTLKYLKAGGRIGKVSGTIGEVLNLKPIVMVGNDGIYHTAGKARGIKKTVQKMEEIFLKVTEGREIEQAAIYTSGPTADTETHVRHLRELMKSKGIRTILEGKIVPSMLVHVGPGLIGIAFRMKPA